MIVALTVEDWPAFSDDQYLAKMETGRGRRLPGPITGSINGQRPTSLFTMAENLQSWDGPSTQ